MDEPIELLEPTAPAGDAAPSLPAIDPDVAFDFDAPAEGTKTETKTPAAADAPAGQEGDKPAETAPEEKPDGEDEDKDKGEDAAKPRKLSGAERARRRIAALEAENADLRERRPPVASDDAAGLKAAVDKAVTDELGPPPKEEDFADFLQFDRALNAYESAKLTLGVTVRRQLQADAARADTAKQNRVAEVIEAHQDRLDALEKALPGSRAKIEAADANLQVAPHVGQLVLESDKSAELHLHLIENPTKLAALNGMSPLAAAKEFGRLEAGLSAPQPRTETKAPPPPTALKGGASPSSTASELDAWMKKTYGG